MALGWPIASENPHLDLKTWRYWLWSFDEFQVRFDDAGRVSEVSAESRELLDKVAASLEVPDAGLRADLVASQIAGLLVARYLLRFPDIADASVDELIDRVGPTIQRYLVD